MTDRFNSEKEAKRKYKAEYYQKNKERIKEKNKKYRIEKDKEIKQSKKEYYQKNRDNQLLKAEKQRKNNPQYHKQYNKRYWQKIKERLLTDPIFKKTYDEYNSKKIKKHRNQNHIKEKNRLYKQKNREKDQEYKARRRSRENPQSLNVNKKIILTIYKTSKRISDCLGIKFHVDHIIPLSKGGLHHENNLQILPAIINMRKGDRIL